ncbi:hypothetical protein LguiB_010453 [Lonicera macranthoides]
MELSVSPPKQENNQQFFRVLEALKQASQHLQTSNSSNSSAIKALLELENESNSLLFDDPQLSTLSAHLTTLKTLIQSLHKSLALRKLFLRHDISKVCAKIESEIQSWIDREIIETLTRSIQVQKNCGDEYLIDIIDRFKDRISLGFDRELQHLVLKSKVFEELGSMLCDSRFSKGVRERSAFAIAELIQFNKDVFVGKVLMSRTIRALIALSSLSSLKVLSLLIKLIKSPLVDEIECNGQIPKILSLLSYKDGAICLSAMDCVLEIGYFGRKEVIEVMINEGLIEKLVDLERKESVKVLREPLMSCVGRFAVQVEVGEGLRQREKREVKQEILKRVRVASVSDAEFAFIAAEVLWGSSP